MLCVGNGVLGTVIPGCAETYESESGSGSGSSYYKGEESRRGDRHQKLRRFRRGDALALPEGITTFIYNDGETPLTYVSILDVGNDNNQLDFKFRVRDFLYIRAIEILYHIQFFFFSFPSHFSFNFIIL